MSLSSLHYPYKIYKPDKHPINSATLQDPAKKKDALYPYGVILPPHETSARCAISIYQDTTFDKSILKCKTTLLSYKLGDIRIQSC